MFGITVFLQLLMSWSLSVLSTPPPEAQKVATILFGVALVMTAMYSLGCTAALFAAEREEHTHEFLCLHAPSSRALIAGKAAIGLTSTVGLIVILWLVAALLSG